MEIATSITGLVETNCYLVWEKESREAFLIDPGAYAPDLAAVIREEQLDLKYIVLTHGHGDHIGGLERFRIEFPEAKVAAGKDEVSLLANPALNLSAETTGRPLSVKADILLSEGDELLVGGLRLKIIETPGHTDGGISILIGDTLFSGDTLFYCSIGRSDLPGGDGALLLSSIREKLFVLPDETKVYPGHMRPTEIGYEKRHNMFL